MRPRSLLPSLVIAALAALSMPALAAYPDKPIRLIVPSAPGGAPDALMRALGTQLSQQMGVPVVIDNKPGGSYTIGTMDLVRSAPDGYTLAYGNVVSLATNKSLLSQRAVRRGEGPDADREHAAPVQPDGRQQRPAGQNRPRADRLREEESRTSWPLPRTATAPPPTSGWSSSSP